MPSILGASLSELLRQGSQFGQGVVRGREQRQQAEQEAQRSQQREALEQALLESQIANQESLTRSRDRPETPKPLTQFQLRGKLLEAESGLPGDAPRQDVLDRLLNLNQNIPGSQAQAIEDLVGRERTSQQLSEESGERSKASREQSATGVTRRELQDRVTTFAFDAKQRGLDYGATVEDLRSRFPDAEESVILQGATRAHTGRSQLSDEDFAAILSRAFGGSGG